MECTQPAFRSNTEYYCIRKDGTHIADKNEEEQEQEEQEHEHETDAKAKAKENTQYRIKCARIHSSKKSKNQKIN